MIGRMGAAAVDGKLTVTESVVRHRARQGGAI